MDINSIINGPPSLDAPSNTSLSTPLFQTAAKTPTRRSSTKEGRQKLFQCTGFGDCKMVFTRSEHLARHARKHTGEKPFQCVVPNCNRMFSRFDNMMQHTQTHNHRRDHSKQPIILNTDLRRQVRKSSVSSCSSVSSPVSETSPQLPSPQLPKLYPLQIPSSPVSPLHQDRYLPPPPLSIPIPSQSQWNSPMPVSPVSPISPYSSGSYSPGPSLAPLSMSEPTPSSHTRTASQPNYEPSPVRISNHGPRTASDPTPFVYTHNSWKDEHSPPSSSRSRMGRRLSIFDLCNPIETLMQPGPTLQDREAGIELTEDEIEALQGIGKFHCYPVKKEEIG